MESTIKTLTTKDDLAYLLQSIKNVQANTIKWMFIFWLGQVAATLAIFLWLR